jgi:hypothetical protein
MMKWIGSLFSLVCAVVLISFLGPLQHSERYMGKQEEGRIAVTQYRGGEEKKGERDSHMVQILKELKQTVDEWLKSINEEIEREDVTRFKVRFLEILRSILEWVKDRLDSWLESSREDLPEKKEKGGSFQQIRQRQSSFSGIG